MAGHIPLVRDNLIGGAEALRLAEKYLNQKCSVMIFPEGTRSPDGRIHGFNDGAFYLAIKAGVAILPIALEGSYKCFHQGQGKVRRTDRNVPKGFLTHKYKQHDLKGCHSSKGKCASDDN